MATGDVPLDRPLEEGELEALVIEAFFIRSRPNRHGRKDLLPNTYDFAAVFGLEGKPLAKFCEQNGGNEALDEQLGEIFHNFERAGYIRLSQRTTGAYMLTQDGKAVLAQGEAARQRLQRIAEAESIADEELRRRCLQYLRTGHADTAVREASVVLEDRVRRRADLPTELIGTQLMEQAFKEHTGRLVLSEVTSEQEGAKLLFRAAVQLFKNPTSHRIMDDYEVTRARQVIGFIDLLLALVESADRRV